jgi:histidine ammonia-lyase
MGARPADNPLIFAAEVHRSKSRGQLHGRGLALWLDMLAIALPQWQHRGARFAC